MPRITITFIIMVVIVYVLGARYPMLAQKFGLA